MIKKINVLLERLIAFLLCLLLISACSILPLKKSIFSEDMKNSRKAVVTVTQEHPSNSSSTNTREAIISTDSPNLEAYRTVFTMKDIVDVAATDWAFQALQSLVERYGVVQVYADNTFRGDRATTRYETAHLINSALTELSRTVKAIASDSIRKDDFDKMSNHISASLFQLGTLNSRTDALEARVGTLEKDRKN